MNLAIVITILSLPVLISIIGLLISAAALETTTAGSERRTKNIRLWSIASVISTFAFLTYMYGIIWYIVGYLILGFVWSLVHWRIKGRKYLKMVDDNRMSFQQAVARMDPKEHTLYIVSGIFIWPLRLMKYIGQAIARGYRAVKYQCNDAILNWQLKEKNNWFYVLYDRIGITKTERVTEKMKRD